jgi:hypothetical protein
MRSRTVTIVGFFVIWGAICVASGVSRYDAAVQAQAPTKAAGRPQLTVRPVADFEVTGSGDNAAWNSSEWTPLRRRQPDGPTTRDSSRCIRRPGSIS